MMEIVAPILTVVLATTAGSLILMPLLRGTSLPADDDQEGWSVLGQLREQRNTVFQAIQDLDQEAARDNISPDEHRALRANYVRQAASLIREIEGREHVLDEEIERAVRLRRQRASEPGAPPSRPDERAG